VGVVDGDLQTILIRTFAVLNQHPLQLQIGRLQRRLNGGEGDLPAVNDEGMDGRRERERDGRVSGLLEHSSGADGPQRRLFGRSWSWWLWAAAHRRRYATIEFKARKEGTQLVITEQGVFLDDFDDARGRERGTPILINQLAQALHRQSTSARS